ncbi:MAG: type II toxin-antitoxin system MqsA family antitoxin [Clostridia bacterium]|nr:type II toxin-antitoxin system MqsA family antitoxin [Clostridia bacterium]
MRCFSCNGNMVPATKKYVANLDNCVIIIKNVPALVCDQCGEVSYTDEVFAKLEAMVDKLAAIVQEVAIVEYSASDKVA